MLVLSRQESERIVIEFQGATVTVCVTRVGRSGVRLGITAPPEVRIDREEVVEAKRGRFISRDESDGSAESVHAG